MNLDDLVNLDMEEDEDFCSTLGIDDFLASKDFDFDASLDDGDLFDDNTVATGKEITGRWTREEHVMFLKGLEMYGKGWKKIAQLIKTRTVVQIRTHAQKYFLKLTKARENGNTEGLSLQCKGFGSNFRKKMKKRRADRPVSVAPPLKPYVKPGRDPGEPVDIDSTLYEFLTPNIGLSSSCDDLQQNTVNTAADCDGSLPSSYNGVTKLSNAKSVSNLDAVAKDADSATIPLGEVGSQSNNNKGGIKASISCPQFGATMNSTKTTERRRLSQQERMPPQWYSTGEHVTTLLKEAEGLDWSIDIPTYANTLANGATNNKNNQYLQYLLPNQGSDASNCSNQTNMTETNRTVSPSLGAPNTVTPDTQEAHSPKRVRIDDQQREKGIAFDKPVPYNYHMGSSHFPIADPSSYVDPSILQNGQSNFKKTLKSVSFDALNSTSLNEVKVERTTKNNSPTAIAGNIVSAVSSPNLT